MKRILLVLLNIYKNIFSSFLPFLFGGGCRFQPTCSEYAKEAVQRYGIFTGTTLSLKRIFRCHPFGGAGFDPVP